MPYGEMKGDASSAFGGSGLCEVVPGFDHNSGSGVIISSSSSTSSSLEKYS